MSTPISFRDCQLTQCKNCKFSKEIPIDKASLPNYFDYCKHRKEFEKQEKMR